MKFRATDNINVRSGPSIESPVIEKIAVDVIVESDEYDWKAITLSSGERGFCAATYLQAVPTNKWFVPIRVDKFKVTQKFLAPDLDTYPKTGHHPGADYGTQGEDHVPLYFCADGAVIESGFNQYFGNYFFYYVAEVDRTFAYFHLRDTAPAKLSYRVGEQCGVVGETGLSYGPHLHLECMKGRKTSADRSSLYFSKEGLIAVAEDPDAFIRARL